MVGKKARMKERNERRKRNGVSRRGEERNRTMMKGTKEGRDREWVRMRRV